MDGLEQKEGRVSEVEIASCGFVQAVVCKSPHPDLTRNLQILFTEKYLLGYATTTCSKLQKWSPLKKNTCDFKDTPYSTGLDSTKFNGSMFV